LVTIQRQADKNSVADTAKKHKLGEQTIYVWRQRFEKLEPVDVERLLEQETEKCQAHQGATLK
jgi:putative transposase